VLSADGRFVAFQTFGRFGPADADTREDIYLHDRKRHTTQQMSVNSAGRDLSENYVIGGISRNGRYVSFGDDNNAWVRDRVQQLSSRVWHEGNDPDLPFPVGTVGPPAVSGNGRFVAFASRSKLVVPDDTDEFFDVFRLNLATGRFRTVSVAVDGGPADQDSFIASLSYNGRYVGFSSVASNLVPRDTSGTDTFVRDMRTGYTRMTSVGPHGPGNSESGRNAAVVSSDGRHMVFESYASDLVPGDTNEELEVFWWRAPGVW
jgi:Tol biopolymer transport system component